MEFVKKTVKIVLYLSEIVCYYKIVRSLRLRRRFD